MTTDIINIPVLDLEVNKKALAKRIMLINTALAEISNEDKANSKSGEVFNLLLAEVQAVKDNAKFLEIAEKLSKLELNQYLNEDQLKEKTELWVKMNTYKLWFLKFNKQVLDSYAKINDRSMRERDDDRPIKISLTQIHKLAKIVEGEFEDEN